MSHDGQGQHIILLSRTTACTAVWARSQARAASQATALSISTTRWLRAAGREVAAGVLPRERLKSSGHTLRELALTGLRLMTDRLEPALFTCLRCLQDDGSYLCITADSIRVGYGSRASENDRFEHVSKKVPENDAAV